MKIRNLFSFQNWKYIIKTLAKNKIRTFLTALGIIIGVWSVIVLISIGNGLKSYVNQQFKSIGSNLIYVIPVANVGKGGFGPGGLPTIDFTLEDAKSLEKIPEAKVILPMVSKNIVASYQGEKESGQTMGTIAKIAEVNNITLFSGRFFTSAEENRGKKVAVIGWKIYEKLFKKEDAIDKKIKIDNQIFTIVGVAQKRGGGGNFGNNLDSHIYIPYQAAWKLSEKKNLTSIVIEAKNKKDIPQIKESAEKIISKKYKNGDFSVIEQTELLGIINNILSVFTIGLVAIAAISLIVGGVGIMNVMFVSVKERIREIGLRKAIGASSQDILVQFLIEAVILSLIGGIAGFLLAILTSTLINRFFPAVVAPWSIFLSIFVSTSVGIIFGIAPAKSASKLSPVEALRYE